MKRLAWQAMVEASKAPLSPEEREELKNKLLSLKSEKQMFLKKIIKIETEIGYILVCLERGHK